MNPRGADESAQVGAEDVVGARFDRTGRAGRRPRWIRCRPRPSAQACGLPRRPGLRRPCLPWPARPPGRRPAPGPPPRRHGCARAGAGCVPAPPELAVGRPAARRGGLVSVLTPRPARREAVAPGEDLAELGGGPQKVSENPPPLPGRARWVDVADQGWHADSGWTPLSRPGTRPPDRDVDGRALRRYNAGDHCAARRRPGEAELDQAVEDAGPRRRGTVRPEEEPRRRWGRKASRSAKNAPS